MKRTSITKILPLFIAASTWIGCGKEDAANTQEQDMATAQEDMASPMVDMSEPVEDMTPPTCESEDDCTGNFSGWQCVDGTCADCDRGDEACVCRANGTCEAGLVCDEETDLCVQCTDGVEGCPCDGETCNDGLICADDVCVEDPCTDGEIDCPCGDGESCSTEDAYCDDMNICRECTSDIEGCACDDDGTCMGDNYCTDAELCAVCPELDKPVGCACDSNSACDTGLTCDETDGLCREKKACNEVCVEFQACDESGAGDPVCIADTCLDGYEWMNGACILVEEATCDGRNGSIDLSASCEQAGKACVEDASGMAVCVDTCETISATCEAQLRDCDPSDTLGGDAVCGECKPGYEDDGAGNCVADTTANCSAFGDPNSIVADCESRNQICEELMGGGAQCGACLSGYELDPNTNTCVESLLCGGVYCADDEYCAYPQTGGAPSCQPVQCGANQVYDESTLNCVSCNISCDQDGLYPVLVDGACACASDVFCAYQTDGSGDRCFVQSCPAGQVETPGGSCESCNIQCGNAEGERGRVWPQTTSDGTCFCEVQEGYSIPFGGNSQPQECDADDDGWINKTSKATYDTAVSVGDDATLANFRCELRRIDKFTLENELGQQRHVSLCDQDLIDYEPGTTPTCTAQGGLTELVLYEADDLDDDDSILLDNTAYPSYGGRTLPTSGRKFQAKELNGLTKACVSQSADFNSNNIEDIAEEQAIEKTRLSGVNFTTDEEFAFQSMSYFIELHSGYFKAHLQPALPGEYVISERSRCEANFTMGSNSGGGYNQSCTRARRRDYDYSKSLNGFDFAKWGCDETSGTCDIFEPPTNASGADLDGDRITDHGICDITDPVPNTPWRGMQHHSQFQCIVLKNMPDANRNYEFDIDDMYDSGEATPNPYEFNRCEAEACTSGDPNCVTMAEQGVYQPSITEVSCTPSLRSDLVQEEVGFVSIRYIPGDVSTSLAKNYQRGCIDESWGTDGSDHWSDLCPGYTENPDAVLTAGNPGDSGKLICSCSRDFGGENCEVACPQRMYANPSNPNAVGTSFVHVGDIDRGYDPETIAAYACSEDDGYCQLHAPVAADNFPGGRRGFWLCGNTSLTTTYDGNGANVPFLEGTANINGVDTTYEIDGEIKILPVHRELLEQGNCTSNCYSAF